jgi:1-deoxy-D-xylulose-5-phosphate reductoisomerase
VTIRLFVAGATGSVGQQTFDVVDAVNAVTPEAIQVVGLSVHRSVAEAAVLAKRYDVSHVIVTDSDAWMSPDQFPTSCRVSQGPQALDGVADDVDVVVNAVVGFAGLPVTIATVRAGKRLALANKESMVAAGPLVNAATHYNNAHIVPVDSEHCAIHQCLRAGRADEVAMLWLTSSGGPFRDWPTERLRDVSIDDALNHPTWSMGPKITIDSSTLMNKGLEVIEAHELFGIDYDHIGVVVHAQSVVHSMVAYRDGTTIAQMSQPTMCGPIAYALGFPERSVASFGAIDWASPLDLSFVPPRRDDFGALDLAYAAGRRGGGAPAWLNAANEVVVEAFLQARIPWVAIAPLLADSLGRYADVSLSEISDVLEVDADARRTTQRMIDKWSDR